MPPPPMNPTRRSSQSSEWVFIMAAETDFEGLHTKSRSPQLNGENISSNQVADASANDLMFLALSPSNDAATTVTFDARRSPASLPNKPPSNGTSSSTETAGTDDTLTNLSTFTNNYQFLMGSYPNPTGPPPLTQSNMALHQRELLTQYFLGGSGNIPGWVAGSGTGDRLLPFASPPSGSYSSSRGESAAVNYCPMSPSLTASSVTGAGMGGGQEWMHVPLPMPADEELLAAGAWCETAAAVGARVKRLEGSVSLSLSEGSAAM